jgi:hypothetical protein
VTVGAAPEAEAEPLDALALASGVPADRLRRREKLIALAVIALIVAILLGGRRRRRASAAS